MRLPKACASSSRRERALIHARAAPFNEFANIIYGRYARKGVALYLLRAHQLLLLLLLQNLGVLMLIDLARWHLLRMAARARRGARLRHPAGCRGRRPLPQTLLGEVDGLGLRDRAVGVGLIAGPGLILRLLLIEVHALLRGDGHARLQVARELHVLAG